VTKAAVLTAGMSPVDSERGFVQRLLKPDCVGVRHGRVCVTVNRDDRRQTGANVGQRRDTASDFFTIRHAAQPGDAYSFMFGPSSRSTTSLMPNQFTIAATFKSSLPGHSRSSPAEAGRIPVVSDRWPRRSDLSLPACWYRSCTAWRFELPNVTRNDNPLQPQEPATRGEPILDVDHGPARFKIWHQLEP